MSGDPQQVIVALRAVETRLQGMVGPAEEQLRLAERQIARAREMIEVALVDLQRALAQAEQALAECESQVDDEGRRPDCSGYNRKIESIEIQISQMMAARQQFESCVYSYQNAANAIREVISQDIPAATHWLRERERALKKFESGSVGVKSGGGGSATGASKSSMPSLESIVAAGKIGLATGNAALLSAFNAYFEGMGTHGAKYRRAQQEYFRSIVDDPLQPRYVRGWIRQELNRLEAAKRAKAAGLQPPGGSTRTIRGIPGLDVGHRFAGLDHPESFRLEDIWMNRSRPARARRLGLPKWLW
ncbi:MAG: hypothetical protein LC114_23355 [Bryobacterales bacterium]|nr:hypothetical protein [Bryobacterales bacterium]